MKTMPAIIALSLLATVTAQAAEPVAPAQQTGTKQTGAKPAAAKPVDARSADAKPAEERKTEEPAATRVDLDTTQITGNRELPRVLYVVPWKRADLGEMSGKPAKSLLDEVLAPVDRDVFRRQNRYHDALQPDGPAPARAATGGER